MTSKTPGERLDLEIAAEAVGWIRDAAERITGGNCTFVDDDLAILAHLANNAVEGGLTHGLHETIIRKLEPRRRPTAPASGLGEEDVERVARALEEVYLSATDKNPDDWPHYARAALAALSPPPRDGGRGLASSTESGAGRPSDFAAGETLRKSEGGA